MSSRISNIIVNTLFVCLPIYLAFKTYALLTTLDDPDAISPTTQYARTRFNLETNTSYMLIYRPASQSEEYRVGLAGVVATHGRCRLITDLHEKSEQQKWHQFQHADVEERLTIRFDRYMTYCHHYNIRWTWHATSEYSLAEIELWKWWVDHIEPSIRANATDEMVASGYHPCFTDYTMHSYPEPDLDNPADWSKVRERYDDFWIRGVLIIYNGLTYGSFEL